MRAPWNRMRRSALCAILLAVASLPAQNARIAPAASADWITVPRVQGAGQTGRRRRRHHRRADSHHRNSRRRRFSEIGARRLPCAPARDAGLKVQTDEVGNVIGERPAARDDIGHGRRASGYRFPRRHRRPRAPRGRPHLRAGNFRQRHGTRRAGGPRASRCTTPISQTRATILFVADVGEEGEGNLRGMRKLVETYGSDLRYVIALDGSATDYITNSALASRRVEITITGPGGHSWSDFGAPNPIHALARGIARS